MRKLLTLTLFALSLVSCNGGGGSGGGSDSTQQVLPTGNFAYSDGTTYGIHGVINSQTYTFTHYDIANDRYAQEVGLISYDGNLVTFTVTSTVPSGCLSGSGTWKFSSTDTTVTLEATESGQPFSIIVGARVAYDASAAIGGTASINCWL